MTEQTCEKCRFWYLKKCHRYPPVPMFSPITRSDRGEVFGGVLTEKYPSVNSDDWCGEFQEAKE